MIIVHEPAIKVICFLDDFAVYGPVTQNKWLVISYENLDFDYLSSLGLGPYIGHILWEMWKTFHQNYNIGAANRVKHSF